MVCLKRAEQHEEFTDESVRTRQADRGQHHERQHDTEHRDHFGNPAETRHVGGTAPILEHTHQQEERGEDEADERAGEESEEDFEEAGHE